MTAAIAIAIAAGASELVLRWSLFHTSSDLAAKDATYYARDQDELWIYRYLFAGAREYAIGFGHADVSPGTRIEFYKRWSTSLVPDAELGYVRKPDVRTPCHETTRLATRGTHEYPESGPKVVFFGDSFVESAACSDDTLPAKIERLTGIDALNYGVGGYGLDQMYLLFRRIVPQFDRADCLYLVGLIQDDVDRVLLKVRSSPKPYFTVRGDDLELHTDHIHPATLNDYFARPPARSYLIDFLRGRFGEPVYRSVMRDTRDARRERVDAISRRLFRRFDDERRRHRFRMAFVILPTPGAPFDERLLSSMRVEGLDVVDLQGCLRASGRPDTDLYAELHPTSLGNDLLAACLVRDLHARALLH